MTSRGEGIRRIDLLVSGAVVVLALVEGLSQEHHRAVAAGLFGLMGASLAVRRKWPLLPVMTVAAAMVVLVASGVSLNAGVSMVVVVAVAAYSAGAFLSLAVAISALSVLLIAGAVSVLLDSRPVASNLAFVAVLVGLPWGLGVAMRARQRYVDVLEERSSLLERDREARAEAAVAEERARIARDLHDIVSHSLSVISLQAGGVRRLLTPDQEKERRALMAVEHTARTAIAEMHHMLGLLRPDAPQELAPQPGLAQLPALLDRTSVGGVAVDFSVEGCERPLTSGVELAVYRIVQEALTNVTKHSDAERAQVTLRYGERALHVTVSDRGRRTGTGCGAGAGLRGMRERVAVYGGTLDAGPGTAGGYHVDVELPYPVETA